LLALIAGTVSYLHMHLLVELHGQPGWVAALTPLSVDGMIVAASTTLLADSRSGGRGGFLPWALLVVGSAASLAANVAAAQPTGTGRVIAAWPSFALIAAYELLMRQIRRSAAATGKPQHSKPGISRLQATDESVQRPRRSPRPTSCCDGPGGRGGATLDLRRQAWEWALANRAGDGSLPSGAEIARQYGRHERWGRLVKRSGTVSNSFSRAAMAARCAAVSRCFSWAPLIRSRIRAVWSAPEAVSALSASVCASSASPSRVRACCRSSSAWASSKRTSSS
jgi:hypothetical protein